MSTSPALDAQQKWQQLDELLHNQQRFLELMSGDCCRRYLAAGGRLHCQQGCAACCTLHVHCLFSEARRIAASLDAQQTDAVNNYAGALQQLAAASGDLKTFLQRCRHELGGCPFLDEHHSCRIYALRPLACRALLSSKEPYYCGLDFSALSSAEKQDFMASLDRDVVNFPTHYLAEPQHWAAAAEQHHLQQMLHSFGLAISGNLPYLVYLEKNHQLSARLATGADTTRHYLRRHDLDNPLLLHILPSSEATQYQEPVVLSTSLFPGT